MTLEKINLTAGDTDKRAAFDRHKMDLAGVSAAELSELIARNLGHFAQLVSDGCGFGITVEDGKAEIFGLANSTGDTQQ